MTNAVGAKRRYNGYGASRGLGNSVAKPRTAETAFNTALGNVLRRKHPLWPDRIGVEQTNVFVEAAGLQPDIIVRQPGALPVAVETEYAPARTVENDACERLGKTVKEGGGAIEQALAVRIPEHLARVRQSGLEDRIESSTLQFCMLSGDPENPVRWPESGWLEGGVDDLADCIELAALSESRIALGMNILETGIAQAAYTLRDECEWRPAPGVLENIARELHQEDNVQTSRMAMAIVANAITFHAAIAEAHNLAEVDELRTSYGFLSKERVLEAWRHILTNINYWPIFKIAADILADIPHRIATQVLDRLNRAALQLVDVGATSHHDLCGRMFQRLITDRKFLATFYTLPSSAALLAELAAARLETDWSDRRAVAALRIGDFACGTGALLNATYEAVLSRYRRTGGADAEIHPDMMANALVGSDIMPAATHLTASILSSTHPGVTFDNTSIITLPYGEQPAGSGRPIAIGALDLIEDEKTIPLFGTGQERLRGVGVGDNGHVELPHGGFDLVIMNPPFTRPTGHEAGKIGIPIPSFAGFDTADDEQKHMSQRLRKIRKPDMVGHGNAGLASNFIDLAHAKVKSGGVLALVLPASFLQGEAWAATRRLFGECYKNVVIVSIATSGSTERAFSADTGMAEVLVVATKKEAGERTDGQALFVNLLRRPRTLLEAATVARSVRLFPAEMSVGPLAVGNEGTAGCCIRRPLSDTGYAALREAGVAQAAAGLARGELHLPRRSEPIPLPVVSLDALGSRGLYHMDISGTEIVGSGLPRGPFDIARPARGEIPTWPALWAHMAERETRMTVLPDRAGRVRPGCEERAAETWRRTASRLHFNRDFQINSQSLAACITHEPSIGGRAWPNFLCAERCWEAPLVLWANTTFGLVSFWWIGTRQQQGRAMLTISRLPSLPSLDPRSLTEQQLDHAKAIFDDFESRRLLPANEAWRDEVRQELDRAVLIDLLGLPEDIMEPLALLRRQWCAEPSVHGGKGTAPPGAL